MFFNNVDQSSSSPDVMRRLMMGTGMLETGGLEMNESEKTRGWDYNAETGVVSKMFVGAGKVSLNIGKAIDGKLALGDVSLETLMIAAAFGYGLRADRAGANDKTVAARYESAAKLFAHYATGTTAWDLRESAEQRAAREQMERYNDLVECFRRFDGRDATATDKAIATICERQKWGVKDNGVSALLGTPQLKGIYTNLILERNMEKAKPSDLDVSDIFDELSK
jgi:hypothetical protein